MNEIPPPPPNLSRDRRPVAALVCGIIGLVTCLFPFSIVAWVLGKRAKNAMKRGESDTSDSGLATAGVVLGIIGSVFSVLWISGIVFVVAISNNFESSTDSSNRDRSNRSTIPDSELSVEPTIPDSEPSVEPTITSTTTRVPTTTSTAPQPTVILGDCHAGLVLQAGEGCRYRGTANAGAETPNVVLSVNDSGAICREGGPIAALGTVTVDNFKKCDSYGFERDDVFGSDIRAQHNTDGSWTVMIADIREVRIEWNVGSHISSFGTAFEVRIRERDSRGDWNVVCDTISKDSPGFSVTSVWATFEIDMQGSENVLDLYEIQYRSMNLSDCDRGDFLADEWSPVQVATLEPR